MNSPVKYIDPTGHYLCEGLGCALESPTPTPYIQTPTLYAQTSTSIISTPVPTPRFTSSPSSQPSLIPTNSPTATNWPTSTPSNTPTITTTPTPSMDQLTPDPQSVLGHGADVDVSEVFGDIVDYFSVLPPMPGDPPPAIDPMFELIPEGTEAIPFWGEIIKNLDVGAKVVATMIDLWNQEAIQIILNSDPVYPLPYPVPCPDY